MNLEVLQEHDLLYVKLKVEKPSIYLKEVKNTLASFANVHVSLSTICKSFKHKMNDGSWTRKVLVNPYGERFNITHICSAPKHTLTLSLVKTHTNSIFYKSGFCLPDT